MKIREPEIDNQRFVQHLQPLEIDDGGGVGIERLQIHLPDPQNASVRVVSNTPGHPMDGRLGPGVSPNGRHDENHSVCHREALDVIKQLGSLDLLLEAAEVEKARGPDILFELAKDLAEAPI